MAETKEYKKVIKKSELQAATRFDYKKITYQKEHFLDCSIEEKDEELEICYEIKNYKSMQEVHIYSRKERLLVLIDVSRLYGSYKEYLFKMAPENLYFDENARVYIMDRDIRKEGENWEDKFLLEYKALIGSCMQRKYSYEDYLEGGADLFSKDKWLNQVASQETLEDVVAVLEQEYYRITEEIKTQRILVHKQNFIWSRIYIGISIALLMVGASLIVRDYIFVKPELEAKLQAEIDFIKEDNIRVINDLSSLTMQQLSYDQKYILSTAYVNMESLTAEQKHNILEKIPINGDEKLMEYWIYIGRLNPLEAENIAMQKSDDELLLYAYMLDKDLTETDTEMTGEEKTAKLKELESKISDLAKQYEIDEDK
ncbi:MAG: hypothetical protein J1F18_03520 [Lachnospiraceae bacterium]|nr:hypothetical protein [Lachnospiraceae bacterium]